MHGKKFSISLYNDTYAIPPRVTRSSSTNHNDRSKRLLHFFPSVEKKHPYTAVEDYVPVIAREKKETGRLVEYTSLRERRQGALVSRISWRACFALGLYRRSLRRRDRRWVRRFGSREEGNVSVA